jgi:hypothetical protein
MGLCEKKAYDPLKVVMTCDGLTVSGFGKGSKIKVEPVTKELFKSEAGVDGEVAVTEINDPRVAITVTLQQNSPWNARFAAAAKLRHCFPVTIQNPQGGKYIGAWTDGRIKERPSQEFGDSMTDRTWKLEASEGDDALLEG